LAGALAVDNLLLDDQTHKYTLFIPEFVENFRCNLKSENCSGKFFEFGHVAQKFGKSFEELIAIALSIPTESASGTWQSFPGMTSRRRKAAMISLARNVSFNVGRYDVSIDSTCNGLYSTCNGLDQKI
jgi:hypothetical protein